MLALAASLSPMISLVPAGGKVLYQRTIKRLFFVILSAAKNLFFQAGEILHSAALRSE